MTISTDRLKDRCQDYNDCVGGFECAGKEGAKTCQRAVGHSCNNSAECAGKDYYGSSTKCSEPDDGKSYCCFENDEKLPEHMYSGDCCSKTSKEKILAQIVSMFTPGETTSVCTAPKSPKS